MTAAAMLIAATLSCSSSPESRPVGSSNTSLPATTTLATTTTPAVTSTTPLATTTLGGPTLPSRREPVYPPSSPVWAGDFPDPYVRLVGDVYYAYATEGTLDAKLQVLTSWDLVVWGRHGDALVDTPRWAEPDATWAPAVLPVAGKFLLYYSAQLRNTRVHCISVAVGSAPEGRFVDESSAPLVCHPDDGGAIDSSPYVDSDGSLFLLWKRDGISIGRPTAIYAQRLTEDGLAVSGAPASLITTDQQWEGPQVEAPSMARVGDHYVLMYSGNWWNSPNYGVGIATCTTPLGPCVKPSTGPVLQSVSGALGPGGGEFFVNANGELLVVYHAWGAVVGFPGERSLWITRAADLDIRP